MKTYLRVGQKFYMAAAAWAATHKDALERVTLADFKARLIAELGEQHGVTEIANSTARKIAVAAGIQFVARHDNRQVHDRYRVICRMLRDIVQFQAEVASVVDMPLPKHLAAHLDSLRDMAKGVAVEDTK